MKIKSLFCVLVSFFVFVLLTADASAVTTQQAMGFEITRDVWVTEADLLSEFSLSQLLCESVQSGSYDILRNGGVSLSSAYIKEGTYSAKWQKHNYWPTMWTRHVQIDWSAYGKVSFWVYSEVATNEEVFLGIVSDSNATAWKDFFWTSFVVDWTGWRQITIPFAKFQQYESVAGWNKIDRVFFSATMFNREPNPYTVLYFDDMEVMPCSSSGADFNGDCLVNMLDLREFANHWLETGSSAGGWGGGTDFNHSTSTDLTDFAILSGAFGGGAFVIPSMVVFSANYNTTLNAQVAPSTGVVNPDIIDKYPYGGLNMPHITTGNQGFGGTGEAMMIPGAQEAICYHLDPTEVALWLPAKGKLSLKFYVPSPLPANVSLHLCGFNYRTADNSRVSIYLNSVASYGTDVQFKSANLMSGSGDGLTDVASPYLTGASDPLKTPGWHSFALEWSRPTPFPDASDQENNVDITMYIDNVNVISRHNVCFGQPRTLIDFRIGAYLTSDGSQSLGSYGGLIDNVVIENMAP